MKVKIIRIGNSNGIRLSKAILTQYGIRDKVELIMAKDHIKLIPISEPRAGWEEQFQQMAQSNDDDLLIDDVFDDESFES